MPYDVERDIIRIEKAVRDALETYGLVPNLAKDQSRASQVWINTEICMHSCKNGVAILPFREKEALNENVLIETGYMLALGKSVLLLKDKRVERLPSDMSNLIYKNYDIEDISRSINNAIVNWVEADLGIFNEVSIRPKIKKIGRDIIVYVGGSCDWEDKEKQKQIENFSYELGKTLLSSAFYVLGSSNNVSGNAVKGALDKIKEAPPSRYPNPGRYVGFFVRAPAQQNFITELLGAYQQSIEFKIVEMNRHKYSRFIAHEIDALIVLHGRNGTSEEYDCAIEKGRIVIPVGATGERAQELYNEIADKRASQCGVEINDADWKTIGDDSLLKDPKGMKKLADVIVQVLKTARRKPRLQRRSPQ